MGETLDWWLFSGDGYDRRQNERIDEVAASQRSANSSLRRQLSQQSGDLAQRIERLELAMSAMIELEDVREELNEHADAAAVRRHARSAVLRIPGLVASGAAGSTAAPEAAVGDVPADVPGYWLAPAGRALVAVLDGAAGTGTPADDMLLTERACAADELRADVFHVASRALLGRSSDIEVALDRLFGQPWSVASWQRTCWIAAASGRFGRRGRDALIRSLQSALATKASPSTDQILGTLELAGDGAIDDLDRLTAARRLVELGDLARFVADTPGPSDVQIDERASAPTSESDELAELLAVVVDEGAPGEVGVLDRMAEMRRALAQQGVIAPPDRPVIDAHVGEFTDLVLADLAAPASPQSGSMVDDHVDAGQQDRRRVALVVVGATLVDHARALRAKATTAPEPSTVVSVVGNDTTIGVDGLDDAEWRRAVDARYPQLAPDNSTAVIGIGVAVVLFGLIAVVVSSGLGWLVVLAGGGLAAVGVGRFRARRTEIADSDDQRSRLIRTTETTIDDARATSATAVAALDELRPELDRHLADVVRAFSS